MRLPNYRPMKLTLGGPFKKEMLRSGKLTIWQFPLFLMFRTLVSWILDLLNWPLNLLIFIILLFILLSLCPFYGIRDLSSTFLFTFLCKSLVLISKSSFIITYCILKSGIMFLFHGWISYLSHFLFVCFVVFLWLLYHFSILQISLFCYICLCLSRWRFSFNACSLLMGH